MPLPAAELTAFHKIAKRAFDDISSVAIGFAIDVDATARSRKARIGLGGVAATPIRALDAEAALEGRPWTQETVDAAAEVLGRAGHADLRPAGQCRVPHGDARAGAPKAVRGGARMTTTTGPVTSPLSQRPENPVVGETMPHESAALHVTGHALYTDDLVGRTSHVLHAHPVQAPHAHAQVTRLEVAAAYDVPGVVRVLTAADVPGINDAGIKHDEPLFPSEVMYFGHAVCWVLGESLEAARRGAAAIEVDYDELPALLTVEEAIAAESFQGARPTMARGDAAAGLARAAHVFEGVTAMAGQEHFYLETHCSLAMIDEGGQVFVQSSTQHPTETQEIVAHVLGVPSHAVTVQCLRMGGGFGGKEMQPHGLAAVAALGATLTGRPVRLRLTRQQDMTMTGKRHGYHATWKVGFDDDGLFTGLEATLTADGGWSLDLSEPVLSRALCHIDNAYWIPDVARARPDREEQQDLADRVPRLRRSAGDARDRGHHRPLRAGARDRPGRAAAAQLLRRRAGHAVRPAGPAPRAAGLGLGAGVRAPPVWTRGGPRSRRSTRRTRTPSAGWRSRR